MQFVQPSFLYKTVFHNVGFHVTSLRKQSRDWSITINHDKTNHDDDHKDTFLERLRAKLKV